VTFVDTNVLVYAYDLDAGPKHAVARDAIADLWRSRAGSLSTQVLQEFYVNVTRKVPRPLTKQRGRRLLGQYSRWNVHLLEPRDVVAASQLEEREQLSFWDALIVQAAQRVHAERILSEDLRDGRTIDGVRIENPFRDLAGSPPTPP
jgi:predicted nucleic acid-binding protein